jgi:hypothetical protein
MKWHRTKQCCNADHTYVSSVRAAMRGNPPKLKRSQMVLHVRGEERFWHWKDQVGNLVEASSFGGSDS